VARVERRITPESSKAWSRGTVENWADESLRVARIAYRSTEGSASTMVSGTILGGDYQRVAEPLLIEQMARAGVRLADELNAIFR
jgi:hypothetical protein